jgi:drug/metabolite transporter (DMT)-like permease
VLWMFFLEGLPFAAFMLWRRGPAFVVHARTRWRIGLAGGACSALSYGIAVWAMTVAPVGAVAALRETSVVFALGLGVLLLKERLSPGRWLGVAAVLAGAVALRA